MTGPSKTEQAKPDDGERLFVGACASTRDAYDFIRIKCDVDGWRVMAEPFPLEYRAVSVVDKEGKRVDNRTPLKTVHIPISWGFVLHRFF